MRAASTRATREWRNGRRAGFRILWGNPWEFKSPLSHALTEMSEIQREIVVKTFGL